MSRDITLMEAFSAARLAAGKPDEAVNREPPTPSFIQHDLDDLLSLIGRETDASGAAIMRNLRGEYSCVACTFGSCPTEERMADLFRRRDSRSPENEVLLKMVGMPLVAGDFRLWLAGLSRPPGDEVIARVLSIARSVVRAANGTRLAVLDQERETLGSVLADLINTVLEPMPLAELIGQMAAKIAAICHADAAAIDSYDLGGHRIDRNLWVDPANPRADELRQLWLGLLHHARERQTPIEPSLLQVWRRPIVFEDLPNSPLLDSVSSEERTFYALAKIRTAVLCPLWVRSEFVGLLTIADARARSYGHKELGFIEQISGVVAVAVKGVQLIRDLYESTERERASFVESMERLAAAAEARDHLTSEHLRRIQAYSRQIAITIGLPPSLADEIAQASSMHDIGKIAVPDAILLKPGRLTRRERQVMNSHSVEGERLLVGGRLQVAREVARWHHERWDGKGYPDGLRGDEIPIAARIVAVADVFDALTTRRPYKTAWPALAAFEQIRAGSSTAFDPRVVEAFEALWLNGQLASVLNSETTAA